MTLGYLRRYGLLLLVVIMGGMAGGIASGVIGEVQIAVAEPHTMRGPEVVDMVPGLQTSSTQTVTTYLPVVQQYWNSAPSIFGVQHYGALQNGLPLSHTVDLGISWIRIPFHWDDIEPVNTTPDHYDWSKLDTIVSNAREQGLHLILTLADQPEWAAEYAMGPVYDFADLAEFMGAVVERYDGDGFSDVPGSFTVRYFEIYNEPDNTDHWHAEHGGWGLWGENGADYAGLMKQLRAVMLAASPDAKLVFGGIALDWFVEDGGVFDPDFLDDVLSACQGETCFDVMNFHYYPVFEETWSAYGPGIVGKTIYVRQKMEQYGFADRPLICTEAGWESGSSWGSDELQSRYPAKLYARAMSMDLETVVWFMISDGGVLGLPGLLNSNYNPKESYYAYQFMTTMLEGAQYVRPLSLNETGSELIEGYVFTRRSKRMDIVWTNDDTPYVEEDDPLVPYRVSASTVRVSDKFGNSFITSDWEDGIQDGRLTILAGGSPLYLEYNP
ncbi:MAG: cellulase family glycosylhydrolase [Anaerolineae bacterium]